MLASSVILLEIDEVEPLVLPSYWHVADDREIRSRRRERRQTRR